MSRSRVDEVTESSWNEIRNYSCFENRNKAIVGSVMSASMHPTFPQPSRFYIFNNVSRGRDIKFRTLTLITAPTTLFISLLPIRAVSYFASYRPHPLKSSIFRFGFLFRRILYFYISSSEKIVISILTFNVQFRK